MSHVCSRECKGFQAAPGGVRGYLQVSGASQRVLEVSRVPWEIRRAKGGLNGVAGNLSYVSGIQGGLRGYLEVSRAFQKVSWVTRSSVAFQGVPGVSRRFHGRIKGSQRVTEEHCKRSLTHLSE